MSDNYTQFLGRVLTLVGTDADWRRYNPVLLEGELGVVLADGNAMLKCGDGHRNYSDLPFMTIDKATTDHLGAIKVGEGVNISTDGTISVTYALSKNGGTITGDLTIQGIASANKVYGAVYNDYAEYFERGCSTIAGDIIALDEDADHEQYIKATIDSKLVIGVESTNPSHIIGGYRVDDPSQHELINKVHFIPVALAGRTPVNVIGPVNIGDAILPSEVPGIGRAYNPSLLSSDKLHKVVGYAIESKQDDNLGSIKIFLKG